MVPGRTLLCGRSVVVPQEPTQPLTTFDFTIRVPDFFPRFDDRLSSPW